MTLRHGHWPILLLIASCGTLEPTAPNFVVAPEGSFTLRVGEEARVQGTTLRIRFDAVPTDSRCPINAICVWEGDAQVRLTVRGAGVGPTPVDLHIPGQPRSAVVGGHRLELRTLLPAPEAEIPIPQEQYQAELRISPAG